MSQRRAWHLLEQVLLILCAFYWFGNTGAGLSLLFLVARYTPPPIPCVASVLRADIRSVWIGRDRILVRCARQGRLEIYRGEVSEPDWAALRRALLAQPATGRSTSI